ncbi:hypothetical protein ZEAMMB73_Zm00001d040027 [Zea mays]|uniref:Bowman-Birk serine protease inhibitors family domain-containing protein n=1 Tax=Zea mays TaxID=4577 RepID=A0A1D6MM98_MAIZE|nr:hypothetical protein ZEAMMB73_Zm00001d040027 [Zea mays]
MKSRSSTLLVILVLQALLLSAAVAKGRAGPKKQCWCGECTSWSGVWTCDDLLTKCAATCKNCVPVSTGKGATKYRCRDFLPENCGCKIH